MRAVRDWCIGEGARRVLIAVMCQKRHDRTAPGIRAEQLADRLGLSDRAVRRYVAVLREAGIPVEIPNPIQPLCSR